MDADRVAAHDLVLPRASPALPPARRSYVGVVSLLVAVIGAVACRVALAYGAGAELPWLPIVAAGFEAAMVGGIADWFAVTALFRHPLGIPIPHTALIVERRDKLVDGIVATVQDEWLSPEVIGTKLAAFAPSSVIVDWLRDPEHVGRLGGPLRDILRGAARLLTEPEVATFAERTIRRELAGLPIDAATGRALATAARSASAQAAFTSVATSIANLADRSRTAEELRFWLDRSAATLRAGGKRLVPMLLRRRLVQRKLVEAMCSYASAELRAAAVEADHPLRRTVFDAIGGFAERVASGDPQALKQAETFRATLLESLATGPLLRDALGPAAPSARGGSRRRHEPALGARRPPRAEHHRRVARRARASPAFRRVGPDDEPGAAAPSPPPDRPHRPRLPRQLEGCGARRAHRGPRRRRPPVHPLNGAVIGGLVGVLLAVLHTFFGH